MPTLVFSGDPRAPGSDPPTCELMGIVFPLGQPVDVPESVFARLRTHSHFTVPAEQQPDPNDLRAVHKGFGRFVIVRGDRDAEVQSGLSKADADAFNAMSDADKAAYLA